MSISAAKASSLAAGRRLKHLPRARPSSPERGEQLLELRRAHPADACESFAHSLADMGLPKISIARAWHAVRSPGSPLAPPPSALKCPRSQPASSACPASCAKSSAVLPFPSAQSPTGAHCIIFQASAAPTPAAAAQCSQTLPSGPAAASFADCPASAAACINSAAHAGNSLSAQCSAIRPPASSSKSAEPPNAGMKCPIYSSRPFFTALARALCLAFAAHAGIWLICKTPPPTAQARAQSEPRKPPRFSDPPAPRGLTRPRSPRPAPPAPISATPPGYRLRA